MKNYRRDVVLKRPWFNNVEEDKKNIIETLFVKDKLIANQMKSLLLIPHKNCLTEINNYQSTLKDYSLKRLREEKYISLAPKSAPAFNDEKQSYIIITTNPIFPNETNTQFHDYDLKVYCMCQFDSWELDDFAERPLKMAGIVVGALSNSKMTGIGRTRWTGTTMLSVNDQIGGYVSSFSIIQGGTDIR